jgi:DNA-directed RNA polymerase alpha subunit
MLNEEESKDLFKTRKGSATILSNFIRQIALTQLPAIRPIAFSVGTSSNVITAGNNVIEDMVEFSASLAKIHFKCDSMNVGDIKVLTVTSSVLKVSDLEQDDVIVIAEDKNEEILHTVNSDVEVKIYLRCYYGSVSANENEKFLKRDALMQNNVIVVNSRHCDINSIKVSVDEVDEEFDSIHLEFDDLLKRDSLDLFKECSCICYDMIEKWV